MQAPVDTKPALWKYSDMKTTLELPDDLMREAKIRAAREGKKLKEIVEHALRIGFNTPAPAIKALPSFIKISPEGFPYVECKPTAPASKMTAEELIQMEQDIILAEDLQRAGIAL
jgi:plasmid stability protein